MARSTALNHAASVPPPSAKAARRRVVTLALAGASLASLALAPSARAQTTSDPAVLPSGGTVMAGSVRIGADGTTLTVDQASQRGIINWQSFDIGEQGSVVFRQPDANAVTLNRVISGASSTIAGRMAANGKVYVVNPNGVLFSSTAQVDVGGLVASTANITDADFLAGRDVFALGGATGSILNHGRITAAPGGSVVLIGGTINNTGAIHAEHGDVALAAGSTVTLDAGADGHLKIEVDGATTHTLVQNGGLIAANGGNVLLRAEAADAALSSVVANTGTIEARTLSNRSGRVLLLADMAGGLVSAGGTIDASAPDGGNGGFVETSAASLSFAPDLRISTLAASGKTGTWLVDPYNITVSSTGSSNVSIDFSEEPQLVLPLGSGANINNTTLSSYLATTNVALNTVGAGSEAGNITISAPVTWNAATTLSLLADSATGGIFINANILGTNADSALILSAGAGGISQSSGTVRVGTLSATTANGGSISLGNANNSVARLAASSSSSNFTFVNNGSFTVTGPLTSNGILSLQSAGDLTINAALTDTHAAAEFTLTAGGDITIARDLTLTGSNAHLNLVVGVGNDYVLASGARISLPGASSVFQVNGTTYTLIRNLTQLQAMSGGGAYALAGDIDASATAGWNSGAGFAPIDGFTGTFAGLGHFVDRLTIDRPDLGTIGLFGLLSGGVRDLTLSNVAILGAGTVGGLAGRFNPVQISNVHVTGSVSAVGGEVGGLVGLSDQATISGSSSSASVSGAGEVGGLVGRNRATSISNSYATGSVTSTGVSAGGLVGSTLQGYTLTNVYASGAVTGTTGTGGLIGTVDATAGSVTDGYWDINTTGQATSAGTGGTGITTANARTQATYAGFDFGNTWVMLGGDTRPMLRNEYSSVIATGAALQLMATDKTASYSLGANLDLTSAFTADGNGNYAGLWRAAGFLPVGDNALPFTGSFDGTGHNITGLGINRGAFYVGLFGATANAAIANVSLTGGSVTGSGTVGALIGYMQGGTLSNASATTTVVGTSTTESNAGGLIGTVDGGAVSDSWAGGAVTGAGYQVGGLAGYLVNGGSITQSYATGAVTGTNATAGFGYVGGLVGGNGFTGGNGGTILRSYATGTVTGSSGPIGGFVGHNEGSIQDSYATGAVVALGGASNVGGFVGVNYINGTITGAYSTGRVSGTTSLGGFVGYNNALGSAITNSYWNTQTSGVLQGFAGGSAPGVTGRTTAQLQGSLPAGFSSSAWSTGTNLYPYLGWRYSTTPVAISGTASIGGSGAALSGATVAAVSGGALLGSAVTGNDGYYYILAPAEGLNASGVLTYLDGGATAGAAFSDMTGVNGVQNVALYGTAMHLITGQPSLTATWANYLSVRGSYADTDLSFLGSSVGALTTTGGYGVYLDASGNYALNTSLASSGLLRLASGGSFGLSGNITLSAGGALTLASAIGWTDGSTLTLSTTGGGAITLDGAITATSGGLTLAGSGSVAAPSAVNVSAFRLAGGDWRQLAASLPSFAATNFVLDSGASFLRATGGDGALATPYQIADLFGLQGLASTSLLAQNFVLAADIDATPTAGWNGGAGFVPIGDATTGFTGSLAGAGHSITGLSISRPTGPAGLFGRIGSGGSVSNLTIAGTVRGRDAGLLAAVNGGVISAVTTSGSVTNTGAVSTGSLGGVAGNNSGTITGSSSSAAVSTGDGSAVGGLAGTNSGAITGSYATGTATSGSDGRSGGLVGNNAAGTISGSFATGRVTSGAGTSAAGGLVGSSAGSITDSYATGMVEGGVVSGGLVGTNTGTVANSFATGAPASATSFGGLIGGNSGTVTASFWNTTSSGTSLGVTSGAASGITGRNAAQMTTLATFNGAGWSIDDAAGTTATWRIYDGLSAPLLRSFLTALTVTGGSGSKAYDGSATSTDVGTLTFSPTGYTPALVSGTASYTASSANAATYTGAGLTLSGLYSSQLGYDISFAPGTLVISPTALTVTASNATKTYDGLAWSGGNGVTYSGFVNGETAAVLGGTLAYGGPAQGAINAGTYGLTASGLTATNYTIAYAPGTLLVNPAALTVTAANAIKTYDGLAWSGGNGIIYSGFVNGETAAVLGGTLAYGGTAQGAVNAGSYDLTTAGLTSSNYTIDYAPGTLLVNPAALTVTANDAAKTYDGLAWSGGNGVTYSGFVNGETAAVLGGTLAYGGAAQGAVNAGSYDLTAAGLTSGNYTIDYAPGTLLVNPAALTVTATSISIPLLGDYLPLRYGVSGPIAPRDAGVDLFDGVLATDADTGVPGSYAITQGTLRIVNPNYILTGFTEGTLEIGRPRNDAPDGGALKQSLPLAALLDATSSRRSINADVWVTPEDLPHLQVEENFIRVDEAPSTEAD